MKGTSISFENWNYDGKGQVLQGTDVLADVEYHVSVRQKITTTVMLDGTISKLPGLKDFTIKIRTSSGSQVGPGRFTLHLKDGQKLDFEKSLGELLARSDIY